MERIFELLPAGVEAEVYHLEEIDQSAAYSAGVLKGVQSRALGGYALRVVKDGRVGFATTSSSGSIPWMVEAALATAEMGRPAKFSWPTGSTASDCSDPELETLTSDQLRAAADDLRQKVQGLNKDFLINASASLVKEKTTVMNTSGGRGKTSRSRLSISCGAELVSGQDILNIHCGMSTGRLSELSSDALVEASFGPLMQAGQVVPAVSGPQPVLLTSKAFTSVVIGPLLAAFSGRNVQQRTSPLADKVGDRVFDEKLTIADDATLPMAPSSAGIDDEGVATRRFPLIESGVVKGFIYDLSTGTQADVESTAHARKIGRTSGARLNSLPAPGYSNLIVQPGELSFADLLKIVGNGVIVDQISGTPGFNPSGEFSVTIQLGYLVKDGQIAGRIKNAMLSGSAFQALTKIMAIGKDVRWNGGGENGALSVPAVVLDGLRVIAK